MGCLTEARIWAADEGVDGRIDDVGRAGRRKPGTCDVQIRRSCIPYGNTSHGCLFFMVVDRTGQATVPDDLHLRHSPGSTSAPCSTNAISICSFTSLSISSAEMAGFPDFEIGWLDEVASVSFERPRCVGRGFACAGCWTPPSCLARGKLAHKNKMLCLRGSRHQPFSNSTTA